MSALVVYLGTAVLRMHKELKLKNPKLTKEEKKRLEEAKKAFDNLMKYDYDEAMKRK